MGLSNTVKGDTNSWESGCETARRGELAGWSCGSYGAAGVDSGG